jgi:Spy/CpxP family protein refolding chaperone
MTWRIWTIGSAAVLAGVLGLGAGMAMEQERPGNGGPHPFFLGRPFGRLILGQQGRRMVLESEMNLTGAQRDKLKSIVKSHQTEIDRVATELVAEGRALRATVLADKTDDKAMHTAAEGMSKGIGDAAALIATIRSEARPLLTSEQLKALSEFRADSDKAVDRFLEELGQPADSMP